MTGEPATVIDFDDRAADPRDEDGRETLYNLEAERGLLGALFVDGDMMEDALSTGLKPEMFALTAHARIFEAMQKLIGRGRPADPTTLRPYFEADESLDDIGGADYLARLAANAINSVNAPEYARIIVDFHRKRQTKKLLHDTLARLAAADIDDTADTIIEDLEQDIGRVHDHDGADDAEDMRAVVKRTLADVETAYKAGGKIVGIESGFGRLDYMLGGLRKRNLYVLAARPGMGKTALSMNIAEHIAGAGDRVAFFSLEMDAEQLTQRRLAAMTGIPAHNIRDGRLAEDDWPKLTDAGRRIEEMPVIVDARPRVMVRQMQSRARRMQRKGGLDLVIIDYLGLIQGDERYIGNRVQEVSDITRGLKLMAKELDVPVIVLSQLNRGLENRDDKRPKLADLRDSGSIEQDADVVMFVYREIEYLRKNEPVETEKLHGEELQKKLFEWSMRCERVKTDAEIIVDKNRFGALGTVKLAFEPEFTQFKNPNETGDLI